MTVQKDLKELVAAEVISTDTASAISAYYQRNKAPKEQRLFLIFGILGALLVGLGIILVIAHNWDGLSRSIKTTLSFLPLIVAQILCGYTLLKKAEVRTWRESTATLLFFAIGASIALVSQIYHIEGDLEGFMLTWMLLALPIVYAMRSSMVSLLYILGISYYLSQTHSVLGTWANNNYYWPLLLGVLPYYAFLAKRRFGSNFTNLHHWLIPLSLFFWLFWTPGNYNNIRILSGFGFLSTFYLIGSLEAFKELKTRNNGYAVIGTLSIVSYLFFFSFEDSWPSVYTSQSTSWELNTLFGSLLAVSFLIIVGLLLYQYKYKKRSFVPLDWMSFAFALLIGVSELFDSTVAALLTNLLVLVLGLYYIFKGSKEDHLGVVNFGLGLISVLIVCRFFDSDLSFLLRGGLFMTVGISFFMLNYRMLKKRKAHA